MSGVHTPRRHSRRVGDGLGALRCSVPFRGAPPSTQFCPALLPPTANQTPAKTCVLATYPNLIRGGTNGPPYVTPRRCTVAFATTTNRTTGEQRPPRIPACGPHGRAVSGSRSARSHERPRQALETIVHAGARKGRDHTKLLVAGIRRGLGAGNKFCRQPPSCPWQAGALN